MRINSNIIICINKTSSKSICVFRISLMLEKINALLSYAYSPSNLLFNVATIGNVKGNPEFLLTEGYCKHGYAQTTNFIDSNNITVIS